MRRAVDVDFSQSTGTVSIYYNPPGEPQTKYQNPTTFRVPIRAPGTLLSSSSRKLTAYMLVNNAERPAGHYQHQSQHGQTRTLSAASINASSTAT